MEEFVKKVEQIVEPIITSLGFELVEVEFVRGPQGKILRIYIDKEDGVTLDDCVGVSREIETVIEVEELTGLDRYSLEVSSPGVNRVLKNKKDFARFIGRDIRIKTIRPLGGEDDKRKNFSGRLKGVEGEEIVLFLDDGSGELRIPWGLILRANLEYKGVLR